MRTTSHKASDVREGVGKTIKKNVTGSGERQGERDLQINIILNPVEILWLPFQMSWSTQGLKLGPAGV